MALGTSGQMRQIADEAIYTKYCVYQMRLNAIAILHQTCQKQPDVISESDSKNTKINRQALELSNKSNAHILNGNLATQETKWSCCQGCIRTH